MKLPADRVAQFIKPFVMRRKKEEVLTELPDLIEVVYKNELEDQQKAIYLAQLQQMRDRLAQVTDQEFQRSRVGNLIWSHAIAPNLRYASPLHGRLPGS